MSKKQDNTVLTVGLAFVGWVTGTVKAVVEGKNFDDVVTSGIAGAAAGVAGGIAKDFYDEITAENQSDTKPAK